MFIGSARDCRVSDVNESLQASFVAAEDIRLQLERELDDAADRLSRSDLISLDGAESPLARQSGSDVLDEAEANTTRDAVFAARERLLARIKRLRAALARLETGGYGQCVECGAPIGTARLCALPEATTCVTCQECRELTAAARSLETRHQRLDRGAATLFAEALAATTEQSARAEDALQADTRDAAPAGHQLRARPLGGDKPGRLATRTRGRPAAGSVAGTLASVSERRRARASSSTASSRAKTNRRRADGVNETGRG
jgi:DnaK suppressor protein